MYCTDNDFSPNWIFVILLWSWKLHWQSNDCIDYNVSYCNHNSIYSSCNYDYFLISSYFIWYTYELPYYNIYFQLFILQDLPITSYYKLIDWWFLVCFNLLVITLGFHTYLAYVMNKSKNPPITEDNIKKVQPINDADNENQFISKQLLKHAEWLNMLAKIGFIVFLVIFNLIFWMIALFEHFKSSDAILSSHFFH